MELPRQIVLKETVSFFKGLFDYYPTRPLFKALESQSLFLQAFFNGVLGFLFKACWTNTKTTLSWGEDLAVRSASLLAQLSKRQFSFMLTPGSLFLMSNMASSSWKASVHAICCWIPGMNHLVGIPTVSFLEGLFRDSHPILKAFRESYPLFQAFLGIPILFWRPF